MSTNPIPQPRQPVPSAPQPRKPVRADDTDLRAYVAAAARAARAAAARWADRLTPAERAELAARLTREAGRYLARDADGTYDPARVMAAAECLDLNEELAGEA